MSARSERLAHGIRRTCYQMALWSSSAASMRAATIIREVERFESRSPKVHDHARLGADATGAPHGHALQRGRLLLAGGDTPGNGGVAAELWDTERNSVDGVSVPPRADRRDGAARMLPDGRVHLSGGLDARRSRVETDELFDAEVAGFAPADMQGATDGLPRVAAALPADQSGDIPTDARISIRFSEPMDVRSVTIEVAASRDSASVPIAGLVVAAEGGMLAFFTPAAPLAPGLAHQVHVRGVRTATGRAVPESSFTFTTAREPRERDDRFDPLAEREGRRGIDSPWRKLPPLQAPRGVTALAGQVLLLNGAPLADVTLAIGDREVRTNRTGRFLLRLGSAPSGWRELLIDGTTANRGRHTYGVFEVAVQIVGRKTAPLPYTIWMPTLDTAHAVRDPVADGHRNRHHDAAYPGPRAAPAAADRHHRPRRRRSSARSASRRSRSISRRSRCRPASGADLLHDPARRRLRRRPRIRERAQGRVAGVSQLSPTPGGTEHAVLALRPRGKGLARLRDGARSSSGRQVVPNPDVALYEFTGAMIN